MKFLQCIIISLCMGAFVKPFWQSTNTSDLAAEVGVDWAQSTRL